MKALLYCTKAKPYLSKRQASLDGRGKQYLLGTTEYDRNVAFNGLVCFECDCREAFDFSKVVQENKTLSLKVRNVYDTEEMTFYRGLKTGLTLKQIEVYQGTSKRLFAYHFENIRPILIMSFSFLYKDGTMVYPMTRAPQSYFFAYRKVETTKEDYLASVGKSSNRYYLQDNGRFYYSEKVLVFSIRSHWLCKIANGEKDLEVRKSMIRNGGIEYK